MSNEEPLESTSCRRVGYQHGYSVSQVCVQIYEAITLRGFDDEKLG